MKLHPTLIGELPIKVKLSADGVTFQKRGVFTLTLGNIILGNCSNVYQGGKMGNHTLMKSWLTHLLEAEIKE